jgi:hypothetical protein
LQIITTPVGTSFDQLRAADEVQYKFDRCCKALEVGLTLHAINVPYLHITDTAM